MSQPSDAPQQPPAEAPAPAAAPSIIVPPNMRRHLSNVRQHRKWMKILVWGEPKVGKSAFLAQFPSPKIVIDAGEGGIQQYIEPGSGDVCFTITDPKVLEDAIKCIFANEGRIQSVVIDPVTVIWEDWMDFYNTKFGGDIRGGQWKDVKAPWKMLHRKLQRFPAHIGMSAWIDDILYDKVRQGGEEKLVIRPQEVPKVEKRLPYVYDMELQMYVELDDMQQPTSKHVVRYTRGRRPKALPVQALYPGKLWSFDEKKGWCNIWDLVISPIQSQWSDTGEEWAGVDIQEMQEEATEFGTMMDDHAVGRILKALDEAKTLGDLLNIWNTTYVPAAKSLSEAARKRIETYKDTLKAKLK